MAPSVTDPVSLPELADTQLAVARQAQAGRGAQTVVGGQHSHLRQTLLALVAGTSLGEHDSPGEATLLVLRGHVVLSTSAGGIHGKAGDLLVIPPERHDLQAVEDAAVLLTVVTQGAGAR